METCQVIKMVENNFFKMKNCYSPAYSTGLAVILLFVLVKQVANITVILSKLYVALLTSLLSL